MDKLWKGGQCYQLYSDLYISFYMSEYYGLWMETRLRFVIVHYMYLIHNMYILQEAWL